MSDQTIVDVLSAAMSVNVWGRYGVDVFLDGSVMRHSSVMIRPWGVEATDSTAGSYLTTYYPAARVWKVVPIEEPES